MIVEPDRGVMIAVRLSGAFAVGALGGAFYYLALWRTVGLIIHGAVAVQAAALQLARFMGIGMVLVAVARGGGVALLMALFGILAARFVAIRRLGARP